MPYLATAAREVMDAGNRPINAGELNYAITKLLVAFANREGGLSYGVLNETLGAVEAAKLEFYRRVVVPYEDAKKDLNGDVY